jgi:protein-tyrosine kinase
MSRIEDILAKAARDGQVRRTAAVGEEPAVAAAPPPAAEPVARRPAPPRVVAPVRPHPPAASPHPSPAVANPVLTPLRTIRTTHPHPSLVAAVAPHSRVAEQYRAIRTRIAQAEGDRHCRTILVTSPLSSDGKTLTALNLAITMAQEFHRRVVAVDADLRNGSLHRLFGIDSRPGLSDVLLGRVSLEQAMVSLPDLRLTLVPSGSATDQPTELLGSAEMRRVVDALRTQFDRIVVDSPPAAPLADVGTVSPLADGVVLVVRAGRTPRPAIDKALEEFDADRLLGLVLNGVEEPGMETRP